jgi:hypothetical protein
MSGPEDFEGLSADEWMTRRSPIHPEKLHALGVITFTWNTCELHLLFLFFQVATLKTAIGRIIAHEFGDVALINRIREIIHTTFTDDDARVFGPEEIAIIDNILDVYDICRLNRNSLTHFHGEKIDGEILLARMKGPKWISHVLPNDLQDFRRVADEIWELSLRLRKLWRAMASRRDGVMLPLPDTLPLPELLWKPPPQPQNPTKSKRRPRSSRVSHRQD